MALKEPLPVNEHPRLRGRVHERQTAAGELLGRPEDGRETSSNSATHGIPKSRLEPSFHAAELLDSCGVSVRKTVRDNHEVYVGIGPGRVPAHRTEDGEAHKALAVDLSAGLDQGVQESIKHRPVRPPPGGSVTGHQGYHPDNNTTGPGS